MVGSPLSGYLMERDSWLPMNISLALLIIGNALVLLLPETLAERAVVESEDDAEPPKRRQVLLTHVKEYFVSLKDVWTFIVANKPLMLLMTSMVFVVLGKYISVLLGQYITARYNWKWSKVSISERP